MSIGPRNLITDVAGLKVGHAHDPDLKSGTTVLTADAPFHASVHVMGGAPGTRETDLLAPDKSVSEIDALVLSGGSAFGLDACGGVMSALRDDGRGYPVGPVRVPIVPGAILFDLINGGDKNWNQNPYPELGARAYRNATKDFDIGTVGAGFGAMTARHMGGLGSASFVLENGTTVGALVAVNALGSATVPGSRNFWAAPFEIGNEFGGLGAHPEGGMAPDVASRKLVAMGLLPDPRANTTIAIVATDAPLSKAQCQRFATAAHDGFARSLMPSHTPADGDLVFGVSTPWADAPAPQDGLYAICAAGAHCLARAVARAVYSCKAHTTDLVPTWMNDPDG